MHSDVGQLLVRHARECEPDESCALLCGSLEGGNSNVRAVQVVTNVNASPDRFSMDAGDLIRAYERAASAGMDVVGIFHSHPASAAFPSETDLTYMRTNPVPWLIYSGLDGAMRAFVLDGDAALEVPLDYKEQERPT